MIANERGRTAAPCGIDCGICEMHLAGVRPELLDALAARGIPREKLPCRGCRNIEGDCPVIAGTCSMFACAREHRVGFCFECAEFPCSRLNPTSDRADVLPHSLKVFNLGVIRRGVAMRSGGGLRRFREAAGADIARFGRRLRQEMRGGWLAAFNPRT